LAAAGAVLWSEAVEIQEPRPLQLVGAIILIWLGTGLLLGGLTIAFEAPGLYCKRRNGIVPFYAWIYLGGWLIFYCAVWLTRRKLMQCGFQFKKNDRDFDLVAPRLILGKLLWELPKVEGAPEVNMVIDLTCEWTEPWALRRVRRYIAVPVVDTTKPSLKQLLSAAQEAVDFLSFCRMCLVVVVVC
ncbi:unnamed protein product, partial [Polarella glacialis]